MVVAEFPRFVNHVDDNFLKQVTAIYKERIPDNAAVLDLMSSHVSHLPRDKKYSSVTGHGMNAQEVRRRGQLHLSLRCGLGMDATDPGSLLIPTGLSLHSA